jgi:hypothetical protein
MRFHTGLIFLTIFLCSCNTKYIQIYETDSESVNLKSNEYSFEDENIIITYDLWAERGVLGFKVYNKTNNPIYVDWKNSNFIRLGNSMNYWEDIEYTEAKYKTIRYGYESLSAGYYINKRDRPGEQLPPKSYINIEKFYLNNLQVYDPKTKVKNNIIEQDFNKSNSPLHFRNYLAYSFNKGFNDLAFIDNDFWISKKQIMKQRTFDRELKRDINGKNKFYDKYEKLDTKKSLIGIGFTLAFIILIVTSSGG